MPINFRVLSGKRKTPYNKLQEIKRKKRAESFCSFRMLWDKVDPLEFDLLEIRRKLDWEMINGLLLSDAWIPKRYSVNQNCSFYFSQTIPRKDLVVFVANHFQEILIDYRYFERDVTSVMNDRIIKSKRVCEIRTCRNKIFTELRVKWYPDEKKIIPKDIVLTPKTLAFWFMGDGSANWVNRNGTERKNRSSISLHTDGFTFDDCSFLVNKLRELGYNKACIQKSGKQQPIIVICRQKEVYNFMKMIEPYILECFDYKLKFPDLETYEKRIDLRDSKGRFVGVLK